MDVFSRDKTLPLRAVCALLIVAGHLAIPVGVHWLQPFLELAACSVAIFLFISGYGLAKSFDIKGSTYLDSFGKKRIWKVIWPGLIALLLWYLLVPNPDRNYLHDLYMTFRRGAPPLAQLWYVIEIVFLYLLFWISYRFVPARWRIAVLWIGSLLCLILTLALGYDRNWWIHTLAFPAGVSYMYWEDRIIEWMNKRTVRPVIALGGLLILFVLLYLSHNPYIWILCYIVVPLVCALLVSLLPFEKIQDPVTRFVGKVSYEIYLFHGIAIAFLRSSRVFIESDAWYIVCVYLMTLLMAALFFLVTEIPAFAKK